MSWSFWTKSWQYDPIRPLFTVDEARFMIESDCLGWFPEWMRDVIREIVRRADAG